MRITIATSPGEIERLRPTWERLHRCEEQTVFQEFALNRLAAAHFSDRETPYVVLAESESSAALIPAAARRHNGEITLLGESLFDYRDVLHQGSDEALLAAWNEIARLNRAFSCIALKPQARPRWAALPTHPFANAPCIPHQHFDCDEFRAAHKKLGMYFRRLVKRGVHLRMHDGTNTQLVRTIYDRKGSQPHQASNVFCDPHRRAFMQHACALLGERCEIFTLETKSALVAALVTLRDETARLFYTVYFDPAWAKFSPGVVLIYEVTARTLGEALDCDYMTGEYGYKNRLATAMVPLLRVQSNAQELAQAISRRAA